MLGKGICAGRGIGLFAAVWLVFCSHWWTLVQGEFKAQPFTEPWHAMSLPPQTCPEHVRASSYSTRWLKLSLQHAPFFLDLGLSLYESRDVGGFTIMGAGISLVVG